MNITILQDLIIVMLLIQNVMFSNNINKVVANKEFTIKDRVIHIVFNVIVLVLLINRYYYYG